MDNSKTFKKAHKHAALAKSQGYDYQASFALALSYYQSQQEITMEQLEALCAAIMMIEGNSWDGTKFKASLWTGGEHVRIYVKVWNDRRRGAFVDDGFIAIDLTDRARAIDNTRTVDVDLIEQYVDVK